MTTSLSKSTIPQYDPNDAYTSPRGVPRVTFEGRENYMKNRGSLNIGDWSIQSKDWESPRPAPKVKYEEAQQAYIKNRGSMQDLLTGYCDPAIAKKGPRISKEGEANFLKNKGTFNKILNDYGRDVTKESFNPRVQFEGRENRDKNRGTMGSLFTNYGYHPQSPKPIPRVKFDGQSNLEKNSGLGLDKTLKMVPPSSRPSSTDFFNRIN